MLIVFPLGVLGTLPYNTLRMVSQSYSYQYLLIFAFLALALIIPLFALVLAKIVAPKKPSPSKNATYECGLESKGDAWIQFRIQYYLFALLFIIFDIETVFIYPWAVSFRNLGFIALIEMFLFVAILAVGLAYAWRKKILEWET